MYPHIFKVLHDKKERKSIVFVKRGCMAVIYSSPHSASAKAGAECVFCLHLHLFLVWTLKHRHQGLNVVTYGTV